jgi:hypothetical protein
MHIVFLKVQQQQNSKLLAQTMLASCATIKKARQIRASRRVNKKSAVAVLVQR